MRRTLAAATVALFLLFVPRTAASVNWYSCANDLESLREFAEEASGRARRLQSAQRDLEFCRGPSYVPSERDCSFEASMLDDAIRRFRIGSYDFSRKVSDVELSCGYAIGSRRTSPSAPRPGRKK